MRSGASGDVLKQKLILRSRLQVFICVLACVCYVSAGVLNDGGYPSGVPASGPWNGGSSSYAAPAPVIESIAPIAQAPSMFWLRSDC